MNITAVLCPMPQIAAACEPNVVLLPDGMAARGFAVLLETAAAEKECEKDSEQEMAILAAHAGLAVTIPKIQMFEKEKRTFVEKRIEPAVAPAPETAEPAVFAAPEIADLVAAPAPELAEPAGAAAPKLADLPAAQAVPTGNADNVQPATAFPEAIMAAKMPNEIMMPATEFAAHDTERQHQSSSDPESPPAWSAVWQNDTPTGTLPATVDTFESAVSKSSGQLTGGDDAAAGENIIRQVIDRASFRRGQDEQVIHIRLRPDSMGELEIRLVKDENGLAARISTDNSETTRLLTSQVALLQDALQSKGVTVTQIDIRQHQQNTAGSNLAFNQQQQQSSKPDPQERPDLPRRAGINRITGAAAGQGIDSADLQPPGRANLYHNPGRINVLA